MMVALIYGLRMEAETTCINLCIGYDLRTSSSRAYRPPDCSALYILFFSRSSHLAISDDS